MKRLTAIAMLLVLGAMACSKNSAPTGPSAPTTTTTTAPPTTYSISGSVRSAAGPAIGGATVRVVDGRNAGKSATTDGAGNYSLTGLLFEGFSVEASAPNFVASSRGGILSASSTTATANFSLLPSQVWTVSGRGNTVMDMPTYFNRVRIQGTPRTSCENFIVHFKSGSSTDFVVNDILGTCSIADSRTYDGIHLTNGRNLIEIVSSSGIDWTFTEVR
jgi:hypothetical protein